MFDHSFLFELVALPEFERLDLGLFLGSNYHRGIKLVEGETVNQAHRLHELLAPFPAARALTLCIEVPIETEQAVQIPRRADDRIRVAGETLEKVRAVSRAILGRHLAEEAVLATANRSVLQLLDLDDLLLRCFLADEQKVIQIQKLENT